eukprot:scaffold890_cov16-Prasinocladus_malaysianus.AAC.1
MGDPRSAAMVDVALAKVVSFVSFLFWGRHSQTELVSLLRMSLAHVCKHYALHLVDDWMMGEPVRLDAPRCGSGAVSGEKG